MNKDIQLLEELSLNVQAALKTRIYDGWIMRFCKGYTKRANSVWPLYVSYDDTDEKIITCEKQYETAGLPCIFKLTDKNADLNERLEKRGYEKLDPTDVMTLKLDKNSFDTITEGFISDSTLTDKWLSAYCGFEGIRSSEVQKLIPDMLSNVMVETLYCAVENNGMTVSCASAAIERGYMLIQNVAADPDKRRMGFGSAVCMGLLGCAAENGVHTAYLQVVQSNTAACEMYKKLGFEKVYTYWYMRKK